jgi:Skp family chaperone for outer membrane proteins
MGRVLRETTTGRQIVARLTDAERQVQNRLADLRAEIDTIAEDLEAAQAEARPDSARMRTLAQEYEAAIAEVEETEAEARQQLEAYRTELTVPLLDEVKQVCEDIGRDEGYGLILDRAALSFGAVAADLTDRVIAEVGGGAAASTLIDEVFRAPGGEPGEPEGSTDPEDASTPGEGSPR